MNEFARAAFALVLAVAPLGAVPVFAAYLREVSAETRLRGAIGVGALSFVLLAVTVLVGDPFLDWIDVSPENFQIAAGIIIAPVALRLLVTGDSMITPREADGPMPSRAWLIPLVFPLIVGPASLAAAISYGTRYGEGETIAAAAVASAFALLACAFALPLTRSPGNLAIGALGRLNGALLMIVVVELIIDGVQTV
jgi:multiple antibiotic resistance protein